MSTEEYFKFDLKQLRESPHIEWIIRLVSSFMNSSSTSSEDSDSWSHEVAQYIASVLWSHSSMTISQLHSECEADFEKFLEQNTKEFVSQLFDYIINVSNGKQPPPQQQQSSMKSKTIQQVENEEEDDDDEEEAEENEPIQIAGHQKTQPPLQQQQIRREREIGTDDSENEGKRSRSYSRSNSPSPERRNYQSAMKRRYPGPQQYIQQQQQQPTQYLQQYIPQWNPIQQQALIYPIHQSLQQQQPIQFTPQQLASAASLVAASMGLQPHQLSNPNTDQTIPLQQITLQAVQQLQPQMTEIPVMQSIEPQDHPQNQQQQQSFEQQQMDLQQFDYESQQRFFRMSDKPRRGRGGGGGGGGMILNEGNRQRTLQDDPNATLLLVLHVPPQFNNINTMRTYFSKFGNVENVQINKHKSLAFVRFSNHNEAIAAYRNTSPIFNNRFVSLAFIDRNSRDCPENFDEFMSTTLPKKEPPPTIPITTIPTIPAIPTNTNPITKPIPIVLKPSKPQIEQFSKVAAEARDKLKKCRELMDFLDKHGSKLQPNEREQMTKRIASVIATVEPLFKAAVQGTQKLPVNATMNSTTNTNQQHQQQTEFDSLKQKFDDLKQQVLQPTNQSPQTSSTNINPNPNPPIEKYNGGNNDQGIGVKEDDDQDQN